MNQEDIVIVCALRTPMGGFGGELSTVKATELGSIAIRGCLDKAGVKPEQVEEVYMGCVLPAGLGQAPARQAALGADIPTSTPCTTVNKVCGSGMKTVMIAHDALKVGQVEMVVAGGMESMSRAPYLLEAHRGGQRLGHGKVIDHMFLDGLEDAYNPGKLMGAYAQDTADAYNFSREAQDAYAIRSTERAQQAIANGDFESEIIPVTVKSRHGDTVISVDEQPGKARLDKIPTLKPAFAKDGTVTAANSSSISDGAAALLMTTASRAQADGLKPVAKILGYASHARNPEQFTTAPVGAIEALMNKLGWTNDDVDLFEINEAFAIVTMAAIQDLGLDDSKVNIHGGACALGHPLGASGARIMVTLIAALKNKGLKRGIASLCIGGGEATAIAVEILEN
jgi:acetyl-CoA C-acetyltransferase